MTVHRMRQEMTHMEFIYWSRYYARQAQARELAEKSAAS